MSNKTAIAMNQPWEEDKDAHDGDPDQLLPCPYDKSHKIRASRFPYHLIKCRKNHPKLASQLKTCPFNARHLMPKNELSHHVANCEDRRSINTEDLGNPNGQSRWHVPVSTWTPPSTDEDWDQETADCEGSVFVWGRPAVPSQKTEPNGTTNLVPGLRAPKTLPWSVSPQ